MITLTVNKMGSESFSTAQSRVFNENAIIGARARSDGKTVFTLSEPNKAQQKSPMKVVVSQTLAQIQALNQKAFMKLTAKRLGSESLSTSRSVLFQPSLIGNIRAYGSSDTQFRYNDMIVVVDESLATVQQMLADIDALA